jgi:prephenate dehydrogenase/GNAT superfamily N-acetyltransferase
MFLRIAIVGVGLIGGSIALAVRARWPRARIVAIDRQLVVENALRLNVADAGGDDLALAAGAELIVLAAPVRQNIAILEQLAASVPGEALITDVGGTKAATVNAARRLPDRLRFVGGHPLAGAASAGVEEARADLFRGRPWILTPHDGSLEADAARLSAFVSALDAVPKTMEPEAHDRLMAYISHLPQIAVSTLMHVVGEHAGPDGLPLAGSGLRDTTRLAASPANTWRDVAATNADAVAVAIDDMTAALQRLKNDLTAGDELQRTFDSAREWKQMLDSSTESIATRTYLEMTEPSALRPARLPDAGVRVTRNDSGDPALWRWLYTEVGRGYRWTDRLPWSDDEARAYLTDPNVSLWLLTVEGRTAGYFELRREEDSSVEIVYFGLLPEFTGRRLGAHLLTEAVEQAWRSGARRVWLHTCTFDHPSAIPNYLSRGFRIFKTEQYVVS